MAWLLGIRARGLTLPLGLVYQRGLTLPLGLAYQRGLTLPLGLAYPPTEFPQGQGPSGPKALPALAVAPAPLGDARGPAKASRAAGRGCGHLTPRPSLGKCLHDGPCDFKAERQPNNVWCHGRDLGGKDRDSTSKLANCTHT